ncbi:MAG TPA: glycosyltransferase family 2 protein [Dongiaceae bacterium]|nr:glycosyltransferase family 2 protein [Dongiaceae bacterium]
MSDSKNKASISIVVPFHNEESNVTELYGRLHAVMEQVDRDYQLVFVDDGSNDLTYKLLKEIALVDPRVTIIRLRRNFGQTAALAAGFAHTTGDFVIAMDGDLQHDPADIPMFLEKLEAGYDIVSGWRKHRIDNLWLRRIPSRCANWLMAKLSGVNIHDFGTTFKAYRGDLLRQLPLYGEMHRFIPALASFHGASICEIPIQNTHRKHGVSHYNLSRTFRVMFDLMTIRFLLRYMSRPLHFFGRIGAINMMAGSVIGFWLLAGKIIFGTSVAQTHGLLLVFSAILILVGVQLLALGLLGELAVWQYFNPSARAPYSISEVLDLQLGKVRITSEAHS